MTNELFPTVPATDDSVADQPSTASGFPSRRPDWSFRFLVTALFAVGVWLLAMPFFPAIARCTMQRFHLQTGSFAVWAIQQPIPPMYSFANTTEVRNFPPVDAKDETSTGRIAGRMINHFPTREFTFANARVRYLQDRHSKWFTLRSVYRGQTVKSVYRLDPTAENGWTVSRVDEIGATEESDS
jgi:hypothetical protein